MAFSRRQFLAGAAALGAAPLLARLARAATPAAGKSLVILFQRGAVDGLSMLVPRAEPDLAALRPRIVPADPLELDGRFALHPRLAPLLPLYRRGVLAGIHAVGLPHAQRSHFEAQELMESGVPDDGGSPDGWGNRALRAAGAPPDDPFRAVAVGDTVPRALAGTMPALAVDRLEKFGVNAPDPAVRDALERSFGDLYAGRQDPTSVAGRRGLGAAARLRAVAEKDAAPAGGAVYPRGPLGVELRAAAQVLKGGLGTQLVFIDAGGWDTHANQDAQLQRNLGMLGEAIAAFVTDMGDGMADTVLLTMSEFGRTVAENGTGGTDHGWGTAFFAVGGKVRGGRVAGSWPGLAKEARFEGRDLAVTTDYRDVLAELLTRHLGVASTAEVFPRHVPKPVGLLA